MPQIDIINDKNKSVGTAELPGDIFSVEVKKGLLHEVVRNHLANKRQGTAATKTRGMVRGGGAKPFRQKGTGRARMGTNRSPLKRGGGTVFGPHPRDYSYRMPKKAKWMALSSALAAKHADEEITIIDKLTVSEPKTKAVVELLKSLGIKDSVLMIIPEKDENLELAARNIPRVGVARVSELNVYSLLSYERLLIANDAIDKMKKAYIE